MKNEFESKVLESHTVIDTMEEAANAFEQRINHLEAESADYQNQIRQKDVELKASDDEVRTF